MTIAVAVNTDQREVLYPTVDPGHQWIWVNSCEAFAGLEADVYMDVLFNGKVCSPRTKPLFIAETVLTFSELTEMPHQAARFSAWPGFLERSAWEVALASGADHDWLPFVMQALGKSFVTVSDSPGLVAPRMLATIINEAYHLLAEETATAADVDTAMKLGTNYPMGPVEWGNKIGAPKVCALLLRLAEKDDSYSPHPLLTTL